MTRADLVLIWLTLYPSGWLAAAIGWFAAARVAWPLPARYGTLGTESWRIYAIGAGVLGGLVAAEAYLWAFRLAFKAPVAVTGLVAGLGALALFLAPVPLWRRGWGNRAARTLALLLAMAGGLGLAAAPALRSAALVAARPLGPTDVAGLHRTVLLEAHRYIGSETMIALLAPALPTGRAAAELASSLHTAGVPASAAAGDYLAGRMEATAAADPSGAEPDWTATILQVTEDGHRAARFYALVEGLEPLLRTHTNDAVLTAALLHALANRPAESATQALLIALEARAGGVSLGASLTAGLAAASQADPEASTALWATRILLKNASRDALRPVLPRFNSPTDPVWEILRENCPARTTELALLAVDPDPDVSAGAAQALAYVRQYCVRARPMAGAP